MLTNVAAALCQMRPTSSGSSGFAIPFLPITAAFGFVPLPGVLLAAIAGIRALYVGATEMTKRRFSMMRA